MSTTAFPPARSMARRTGRPSCGASSPPPSERDAGCAPEVFGEWHIRHALRGGALRMVFQPVVDVRTGKIVGSEALARFASEPYRTPDLWFAEAGRCRLGLELELLAVEAALARLDEIPEGVYIAVNVGPALLLSSALRDALAGVPGERVVLELTEHARVDHYEKLQETVAFYRSRGIRLAIDDAGAGYSSFQHILQLRPDIIKLDRGLTTGVDTNPVRFALASSLVTFAASLGARVCAEGIETSAELVALQQLGVEYGQGYFLGRPAPLPLAPAPTGLWFSPARDPGNAASNEGAARRLPSPALRSASRLASLRATALMDGDAEEDFDRVTRLASRLLGAPYAGMPLLTSNGEAPDSLAVAEQESRSWTEADLSTLAELASIVTAHFDMRRALHDLERRTYLVDALLECSAEAVLLLDLDLSIERANERFCALLERNEADLVGRPLLTLKAVADIASSFALRDELLSGRKAEVVADARYLKSDGTPVVLAIVARVVRDATGAPKCIWMKARAAAAPAT